jgi:uncharacterized membrane protein
MPNYNDHFGSTLKGDDLRDREVRVVIEEVTLDEIKSDHGTEKKLVVHFVGKTKGLVLNRVNGDSIAQLAGSPQTEEWGGTALVLYFDPDVMFGTKKVGGIRVKAPASKARAAAPAPAQAPAPAEPVSEITEDDIPF